MCVLMENLLIQFMSRCYNITPGYLLTLASFSPLFAAWTVRTIGLEPALLWISCLALAVLPVAFWARRIWLSGRGGVEAEIELDLGGVEGGIFKSTHISNHLMVQMLIGVAATITPRTAIAVVLLVLVVSFMQCRLQLETINPVATLFGFWIFRARNTTDGSSCIILSRSGRLGKKVVVRRVMGKVFLAVD